MGRASVKQNKTEYQLRREELNLTREKAAELLEFISPERIEKIENEKAVAHPDEVLMMAEKYKAPSLCNYYCATQCPIGQQYVPEVKVNDLSKIILQMVASINSAKNAQERLIEIAADGEIDEMETADFFKIQETLEKISVTVEALQLWSEKMVAEGKIKAPK